MRTWVLVLTIFGNFFKSGEITDYAHSISLSPLIWITFRRLWQALEFGSKYQSREMRPSLSYDGPWEYERPLCETRGFFHGLQTPNEAFFHQNPKHFCLGRQFEQISFGAFSTFLADLSAPILVLWHTDRFYVEMFQNHGFKKWISLKIMLL